MKILLHCDEYDPRHVPIAIRMSVFSQQFRQKGHEVQVLTGAQSLGDGLQPAPEATYCPLIPLARKSTVMRMLNQLSFGVTSFLKSFGMGAFDVVLSSSPPVLAGFFGWLIAKWKRAVFVYDVRDIWPDVALEIGAFSKGSAYCRFFERITAFLYRHADVITTVSPRKLVALREKLPPQLRHKVWLVENGLDERFLQQKENAQVVADYHLEERFTIVYTGNMGLAQGLEHLISLAETLNPDRFQILLFGDGVARRCLGDCCAQRQLSHVRFCGRVDEGTIYTVLRHAAVSYIPLVNANLKNSIPTKTYEALGAGCPVFLVAEGDAADVVRECGFGMTLSPDRIERLPAAFSEFLEQYQTICAKRDDARRRILENHSRQKISDAFEKRLAVYMQETGRKRW